MTLISVIAGNINILNLIPWLIFWAYWMLSLVYEVASRKYKRTVRRQSFLVGRFQSLLFALSIFLVLVNFKSYPLGIRFLPIVTAVEYLGLGIALAGIGFAIWAREHLGANWSGNVVLKKGHTLVTTGPYSIVRHPIYAGITLGIVGCVISAGTVVGLVAIPLVVAFSLIRINAEEKLMREAFGKDYDKYSKRVKAYIPNIW
jgi:protein-S-isoprenylcysteine O-methyltransferase Ste14